LIGGESFVESKLVLVHLVGREHRES
jgi:hypothetical protein